MFLIMVEEADCYADVKFQLTSHSFMWDQRCDCIRNWGL